MMETYRVRWVIDGKTIQAQALAYPITRIRLASAIASQLTEPLGKTSKNVLERTVFIERIIFFKA